MNALALHLRTSRLAWLAIPLAAVSVAIVLSRPDYWVGIWPATGATGQYSTLPLSVITAAIAAWVSSSRRRHRLHESSMSAARPTAVQELYRLSPLLVVITVPYVAGQAVVFVRTATSWPPGLSMWLGYVALGYLAVLLAGAWGWTFGLFLGSTYASVVAALSWFVFGAFLASGTDLFVVAGSSEVQVDWTALAARYAMLLVLLAAIVLTRPSGRNAGRDRLARFTPVGAVVLVVLVVVNTTGTTLREPVASPICVSAKIRFCLWPEDQKYEPLVRSVLARADALPDELVLPATVYEYGLHPVAETLGSDPLDSDLEIAITEGSVSSIASPMAAQIVSRTIAGCDLGRLADDPAPEAIRRWTEYKLAGRSSTDYQVSQVPPQFTQAWETADNIYKLPQAEQTAWLNGQLHTIKTKYCSA